MARLGKPLAVAAFVLCVLFAGFAAAVTAGGENWGARAAQLPGYQIAATGGGDAPVQYAVTDRVTTETFATKDSLPAAVVAAYEQRASVLREKKTALEAEIARMQAEIPLRETRNTADLAAMDARLAVMRLDEDKLNADLVAATAEGAELARRAARIRAEAGVRAEDAARLRAELDAVRADAYRIDEQISALEDRRIRLEGALARAERRRDQLADRVE